MRRPSLLSLSVFVPPLFLTWLSSFGSVSLLAAVPVLALSAVFLAVLVRKKEKGEDAVEDSAAAIIDREDLLSEDDAGDKASQLVESETEMVCGSDVASSSSGSRSQAGSDYSLTDDEDDGLIEITFQEGEPICLINEEKFEKAGEMLNPPDVFSDDGVLTDDEMDEEDSLIELDISMGSIKLPKTETNE